MKRQFTDAVSAHRQNAILEACVDVLKRALVDEDLKRGHRRLLAQLVEGVLSEVGDVETYFRELQPHKLASELDMAHQSVKNALSNLRQRGYIISEALPNITVYTVQPHVDPEFLRSQLNDFCARIREKDGDDRTHGRVQERTRPRVPYPRAGTVADEQRTHGRVRTHRRVRSDDGSVPTGGYGAEGQIEENQSLSKNSVPTGGYDTHGRVLHTNSSYIEEGREKLTTVSPVTTVVGGADLFGNGPVPGVEIPDVLIAAIDGGTAKVGSASFLAAVRAALSRKVEPFKIEMAMRKALAYAAKEAAPREPSPSAMLTRATTFVERSDGEQIAKPFERSTGAPRARNMSRDFDVPAPDPTLSIYGGGWED